MYFDLVIVFLNKQGGLCIEWHSFVYFFICFSRPKKKKTSAIQNKVHLLYTNLNKTLSSYELLEENLRRKKKRLVDNDGDHDTHHSNSILDL